MRVVEETGVQVESAIETAYACKTCGGFAHDEHAPCGTCAARPERLDALRWAIDTIITLGANDPRLAEAREAPKEEGDEGEWRVDALRALADGHEAALLLREVIRSRWPDRPNLPNGLGIYIEEVREELKQPFPLFPFPRGYEPGSFYPQVDSSAPHLGTREKHVGAVPDPIFLLTPTIPLFAWLLLAILDGAEATVAAFHHAERVLGGAWPEIAIDKGGKSWTIALRRPWQNLLPESIGTVWFGADRFGTTKIVLDPLGMVRFAARMSTNSSPRTRVCSRCKGISNHGAHCLSGCLPIRWAGELLRRFHTRPKAIDAYRAEKVKPTASLPDMAQAQIVHAIDKICGDDEWLLYELGRALVDREWCGVKKWGKEAKKLIVANGKEFAILVMLDLERHEDPAYIGLSKQQARKLLPAIVNIPWYLPDVRERVSKAIEKIKETA